MISGTPARARLTGHPTFAAAACSLKAASSIPGTVPGIDEADFLKHAAAAKAGCPVSRALAGVPEITLEASLV